ncbi:MAG: HEPN domain-containing protein [Rhodococcus sp. (in: high G+C Gram-positive bacteria)]
MADWPDTSASTARSWIEKADDDLAIAKLVLNSDIGVEWAACFHAQQAAEKAVKAVLVHRGIDFPKSHRLDLLAGLLPASNDVGFDIDALTDLAPWAVAGRYPEDIENGWGSRLEPRPRESRKAHAQRSTVHSSWVGCC